MCYLESLLWQRDQNIMVRVDNFSVLMSIYSQQFNNRIIHCWYLLPGSVKGGQLPIDSISVFLLSVVLKNMKAKAFTSGSTVRLGAMN